MKLEEAKAQFIQAWGTLGSKWGINRTMAQVHALLLISSESLSAEQIMNELNISRGNANMNLRSLIDWGLIEKELKPGERKEFFVAEKDIWKACVQIMKERKKRELEPLEKVLNKVSDVDEVSPEAEAFKDMVGQISRFSQYAEKSLEAMIDADEHWMVNQFMSFIKK